jgi:hypothetical protein
MHKQVQYLQHVSKKVSTYQRNHLNPTATEEVQYMVMHQMVLMQAC